MKPSHALMSWINVDDHMPEKGKPVVLYRPLASLTQDPNICIGWNTGKTRESPQGVKHNFNCMCHVTHWLELPAEPKVKRGRKNAKRIAA